MRELSSQRRMLRAKGQTPSSIPSSASDRRCHLNPVVLCQFKRTPIINTEAVTARTEQQPSSRAARINTGYLKRNPFTSMENHFESWPKKKLIRIVFHSAFIWLLWEFQFGEKAAHWVCIGVRWRGVTAEVSVGNQVISDVWSNLCLSGLWNFRNDFRNSSYVWFTFVPGWNNYMWFLLVCVILLQHHEWGHLLTGSSGFIN